MRARPVAPIATRAASNASRVELGQPGLRGGRRREREHQGDEGCPHPCSPSCSVLAFASHELLGNRRRPHAPGTRAAESLILAGERAKSASPITPRSVTTEASAACTRGFGHEKLPLPPSTHPVPRGRACAARPRGWANTQLPSNASSGRLDTRRRRTRAGRRHGVGSPAGPRRAHPLHAACRHCRSWDSVPGTNRGSVARFMDAEQVHRHDARKQIRLATGLLSSARNRPL